LSPNPYQPRQDFDEEKMQELISSVRQYGIIQPLVVRPAGEGYQIVAGERRWRAAKNLNLATVPAIVRPYADKELREIALIENLQRHDLNPIEEAQAVKSLMDSLGLTQEDAARKIGRSRSAVANTLRLLNLPEKVQDFVSRGTLTAGQVRPLLSLAGEDRQIALAEKIIAQDLSARDVEVRVKNLSSSQSAAAKAAPDLYLDEAKDKLSLALGTRVDIKMSGSRGKIVIDFFSEADLERLLEILFPPDPTGKPW
jgi:ParB family chromosome partitioning protein